jgi:hypothetical protein
MGPCYKFKIYVEKNETRNEGHLLLEEQIVLDMSENCIGK